MGPFTASRPTTPGAQDSVTVADGSTRTAKVLVTVTAAGFTSFNRHAPHRCTLWFTADADLPGGYTDPMPSNNVFPVEVSVLDRNDPDQTTVHETTIASLKPVALTIVAGRTSATKAARPKVGNADPGEVPGDTIGVATTDGTCQPGTSGALRFVGGASAATVRGGATQTGTLPLMVASSQIQTTNRLSPQRCIVTVSAVSPGGDSDGSNNTTRLVVDLLDKNDL